MKNKIIIPPGLYKKVQEFITLICTATKPIIIVGETGVGKSLFMNLAELTFKCKENKKDLRITKVNCADFSGETSDSNLAKVELFGCNPKNCGGLNFNKEVGFFEHANGGIVFLDEIGELSESVQSMILTFIESGEFLKFGDNDITQSDTFIVAATNHHGNLSDELLSRFHVFRIPPIRERRSDILYYLKNRNEETFRSLLIYELLPLMCHSWPKNVREIEDVIDASDNNLLLNYIQDNDIDDVPLTKVELDSNICENSQYTINKFFMFCRVIFSVGNKELTLILYYMNEFVRLYRDSVNQRVEFLYENKEIVTDWLEPDEFIEETNVVFLIAEIVEKMCGSLDINVFEPQTSKIYLVRDGVINSIYSDFLMFCRFLMVDPNGDEDIFDMVQVAKVSDELVSYFEKQNPDDDFYILVNDFYKKIRKINEDPDPKLSDSFRFGNIWWLSFAELEEIYYKGLYDLTGGVKVRMQKIAGVSEGTVAAKVKKYNLHQ